MTGTFPDKQAKNRESRAVRQRSYHRKDPYSNGLRKTHPVRGTGGQQGNNSRITGKEQADFSRERGNPRRADAGCGRRLIARTGCGYLSSPDSFNASMDREGGRFAHEYWTIMAHESPGRKPSRERQQRFCGLTRGLVAHAKARELKYLNSRIDMGLP